MSQKSNFPSTLPIFNDLGLITSYFWIRLHYLLLKKQEYVLVPLPTHISDITGFSSHKFSILRPEEKEVYRWTLSWVHFFLNSVPITKSQDCSLCYLKSVYCLILSSWHFITKVKLHSYPKSLSAFWNMSNQSCFHIHSMLQTMQASSMHELHARKAQWSHHNMNITLLPGCKLDASLGRCLFVFQEKRKLCIGIRRLCITYIIRKNYVTIGICSKEFHFRLEKVL